ncbi:hypothetical protein LTR91_000589 [Friedmanniomyces endolithicus]|uniref:GST N-terminal domain-containing protein n=3 Tax=Friedmanniomyces endolithicus TaxID=329885 RepID=A0AAN6L2J8_9PEZI|nr:hypothetical protein LTS09_004914 [Friedmanniomyces endolithicus]KAK0269349.1 hypothetical protein LTR35_014838 [Friedmanniomyces endolithicus]KAK0286084.1 hypothetical protein LTS00_010616 [Friedmanniomyces endolithicus]KAK0309257.1 hypothetical protein LTR01_004364 [Friedmanniomyces endolithicus]KAK0833007.1 hypothetical protein LTR73_002095 [Friedmanniomyces endolithicus]
MHTTYITTALLAFTTLAPVLSAAIPGRTTHHGSVTYCSGPNACAPMTIKDDNCLTFGSPMKRLTFSAGLSCELTNPSIVDLKMADQSPVVVLFGYEASAFTWKARWALKIKQIPYTFITVPSMMPRPVLKDTFGLTYRKIPVLAIGKELYCDTSLIIEALEHFFPDSEGYQSLYPRAADGRIYRPMMRGFASYWIDRPFFRATCGLMPGSVWRTSFGQDRAGLIGHTLDPDKLEKKIPENMSRFDMQLSMLEPMFDQKDSPWIFSTSVPSLADLAMYYQLWWGVEVAKGHFIHNLTAGGTEDTDTEGAEAVFNAQRYPGVFTWYRTMQRYLENLPSVENKDPAFGEVLQQIKKSPNLGRRSLLLPTPRSSHTELDRKCGLVEGSLVSVAPDDTGMNDPTIGTLVALSSEEVVIKPQALDKAAEIEVRVHFPRLGFVIRLAERAKL